MTTHKILTTIPADAEVYTMSASTVELAAELGREVAEQYTRRGYPTECVGVTPHTARVIFEGLTVERAGFCPVLKAVQS